MTIEIDLKNMKNLDDYLNTRPESSARYLSTKVMNKREDYDVLWPTNIKEERIALYKELYERSRAEQNGINTFPINESLFMNICDNLSWEKVEVVKKKNNSLLAVGFNKKAEDTYHIILYGAAARRTGEKALVQLFMSSLSRALDLGCQSISLGYAWQKQNHHIGAEVTSTFSYTKAKEQVSLTVVKHKSEKKNVKVA